MGWIQPSTGESRPRVDRRRPRYLSGQQCDLENGTLEVVVVVHDASSVGLGAVARGKVRRGVEHEL